MAKRNEKATSTKQAPVPMAPEVRASVIVVLVCIMAILVALVYRLVKWIAGF